MNGRTLTWSFFPVVSSQVVHCYGFDITDVLSLEAQLRHAQKLESVGQLAAGVAHDFNNILTVIQGYSDSLITRSADEGFRVRAAKHISDAARRAAALTRQLLTFSRKQVMQPKLIDLNALLRNVSHMLSRVLGEDIVLESDYLAELPRIEADGGMIEQIVMNLAVNSRDAMPRAANSQSSPHRLRRWTKIRVLDSIPSAPGRTLRLPQSDGHRFGNGRQDHGSASSSPSFHQGSGSQGRAGLLYVYGIVRQHEVDSVTSEEGAGLGLTIYFPGVRQTQRRVMRPPLSRPATPGAAKARSCWSRMNPRCGNLCTSIAWLDYHVIQAAWPQRIESLGGAQSCRIDLVDRQIMPEMTGVTWR
jgi:hypothetical protein